MEFSPVPMEVEAVTTFARVTRSSCGINARCAAVKAPDVITRNSLFASLIPSFLLRLEPGFLRNLGEELDPVRVALPQVLGTARRRLVPGDEHLLPDIRHRER